MGNSLALAKLYFLSYVGAINPNSSRSSEEHAQFHWFLELVPRIPRWWLLYLPTGRGKMGGDDGSGAGCGQSAHGQR